MESMFQAKENQSQQSQIQPNATPAPVPAAAAPAAQPNPAVGGMDAMFSQKEKAENPPAEQTPPVQHYTAPPGAVTATISAYKPSILERVENMFRYANPNTRPHSSEKDRNDNSMQIIRPEEFWSETEQAKHPMATAIGQFTGSLTSAENIGIMLATEGLGAIPGMTSAGAAIIPRLISAGFSAQMLKGAYDKIPAIRRAWDLGDESEGKRLFTSMVLDSSMAFLAGKHAAKGSSEVAGETQYEKAQRHLREEEIAVGGQPPVEPSVEPASAPISTPATSSTPQRGTVAGPQTALRPTTQATAGIEAPIAAQQQASQQGAFTKWAQMVAKNLASPGKATEFQNTETKPAARQQMISTLSQPAEDKIAAHEALANGEATHEPISGTQTPGSFKTPDEIWPAMQRATEQTWSKAREASAREIEAWERDKAAAISAHSAGVDYYNQKVDEFNSSLGDGEEPMPHQTFAPEDVAVPERPQTFDDLRTALKQAEANTAPGNLPDVITKAREIDVPKAEKALDKWFKDHDEVVSPVEYESAKKLYADSFRYEEIANYLRGKLAKGTLTGGDIRGLEPVVDGKAIRRRGAVGIGEFRRLVGPEAYQNLQDIAKLFDPIEKNSNTPTGLLQSWGGSVAEYLLGGFVGHLLHAGPLGEAGGLAATAVFRSFMNRVLFDPEFGGAFKNVVNALQTAVQTGRRIPTDVMETMTSKLKDFVDTLKNVDTGGEEGAVGRNVTRRNAGEPMAAKFARKAKSVTPVNETPMEGMKVSKRENGDWEFNHPNGTSQMVLHPEADPRPGYEDKTQLRQTGISAVDAPGAGQQMMDDAVARMKNLDNVSRIVSDHPDLRSPENEGHWSKLARRGHNVETEPAMDSDGKPFTGPNGEEGKAYSISNEDNGASQVKPDSEGRWPVHADDNVMESHYAAKYPEVADGEKVDGREVIDSVDNLSSIAASFPNYIILDG